MEYICCSRSSAPLFHLLFISAGCSVGARWNYYVWFRAKKKESRVKKLETRVRKLETRLGKVHVIAPVRRRREERHTTIGEWLDKAIS